MVESRVEFQDYDLNWPRLNSSSKSSHFTVFWTPGKGFLKFLYNGIDWAVFHIADLPFRWLLHTFYISPALYWLVNDSHMFFNENARRTTTILRLLIFQMTKIVRLWQSIELTKEIFRMNWTDSTDPRLNWLKLHEVIYKINWTGWNWTGSIELTEEIYKVNWVDWSDFKVNRDDRLIFNINWINWNYLEGQLNQLQGQWKEWYTKR